MLKVCDVNQPDMVSVQLNGEFVNKEDYQGTQVKEGDEVSRGDLLAIMNSDGIIHQIEALNAELAVQRAKTEKLTAQKRNLDVELDAQVSTKNEEINSQKV